MMQILRVECLSKSFGGLQVLQDISFQVEGGEKIAIIGPNGAGKTTLFNVLGGQLSATEGSIYLSGEEITHLAPNRRLHLGLARSYQLNNLFFKLPLLDNILLALYGAERSHIQMFHTLEDRDDLLASARDLLEPMGLWEKRFDSVTALSYGDQRLVEIAFALASHPKIIMLDEPSAGLPTTEAATFAKKIRELSGNATLLFCAHDMDLVFNLADKIMVLYFGKIIAQGLPQDIKADPRVQEIYLGSEEPSADVRSR
jgi:branched-chain amino acid transport system ATP-binding protein